MIIYFGLFQCILTQLGAKIGFYQGDIRKLTDDLQTLKPTIFVTVPRLLNRMYDQVRGMYDKVRACVCVCVCVGGGGGVGGITKYKHVKRNENLLTP